MSGDAPAGLGADGVDQRERRRPGPAHRPGVRPHGARPLGDLRRGAGRQFRPWRAHRGRHVFGVPAVSDAGPGPAAGIDSDRGGVLRPRLSAAIAADQSVHRPPRARAIHPPGRAGHPHRQRALDDLRPRRASGQPRLWVRQLSGRPAHPRQGPGVCRGRGARLRVRMVRVLPLHQDRDRDPGLRRQSHRRGRGGLERQAALRADVRHRARLRRGGRRLDGDHRRCGAGPRLGLHPARLHHRHHRRARVDGRRAPGRRAHRGLRGAGGVLRRALDEKHVLVRPVDRGAGAAPAGPARTPRVSALWADTPPRGRVLAVLLLAAFLAAPLIADRYLISVLILVLYFAYVGQAWNLLMGFAGQLSLGHALYLGIGAYVAAALWIHFGVGPWLGVFAAIPIAALGGAFIGFDHWDFTGASAGFFLPIGGEAAAQWWNLGGGPLLFYYVALALATGATGLIAGLRRSALGYRWLAVREDAEAARALGINIFRARMAAMLISSSMTAVAGVFYAFYYRNMFPAQVFDIGRSIELILAPIIGGLGTVFGPIVGALILTPLGEALIAATQRLGLDAPGTKAVFYGLALMVIIWLRPNGVWPWLADVLGIRSKGP